MGTVTTHWQDMYHGNWPTALTGAVVAKAGEGASYSDPRYSSWAHLAALEGHNCFAYYALHRGATADMVAQAKRAHSLIGTRPAMFDVETWRAESGSPAGIATLAEALTAVQAYREAGGTMNVMYLPRSQWVAMGSPNLLPLIEARLHIINADYRAGSATPHSAAWESYGGMTPFAVQDRPCHNVALMPWANAKLIWTAK